jgi:hypothetical protein
MVLEPHHKVIRVPHHNHISTAAIFPPPFNPQVEHVVQEHVRQKWRDLASNNLAKNWLSLDNIIPRTRLRPRYGQGWSPP